MNASLGWMALNDVQPRLASAMGVVHGMHFILLRQACVIARAGLVPALVARRK